MKKENDLIKENEELKKELKQLKEKNILRDEAEKIAKKATMKKDLDKDEVIHELQVYQVELEMQNKMLHQTQTQLQESKNRYFALFDRSPIGHVIVDSSGVVHNVNLRFMQMIDSARQDIITKSFVQFVYNEDQNIFNSRFKAFYKNPAGKNIFLRLKNNNRMMYVDITGTRIELGVEKENNLLLAITDITEQTKAERTVENFFQQPMNIHMISDMQGTIERTNLGFKTILDYDPKELIGTKFFELVHPDDIKKTEDEMKKLAEGITTFEFENRYKHRNGTWRILKWSSTASLEDGKVYAVASDITEQIKWEKALKASEERLNLIIKGSNDAAWDWDLIEDELYYSPQWWAQIGYKTNEIPFDSQLWARLRHPDDIERVDTFFADALRTMESYEVEFRLRHKDGHYVPVLSRGFITRDEDGSPTRVSGTNLDLTERKKWKKLYQIKQILCRQFSIMHLIFWLW